MLPEAFKPSYKALIDNLIPILNANLDHEELTSQILVFLHSNLLVLGAEMMGTICQVVSGCAVQLPYPRTLDIIRILSLAVDNFKLDSLPVLQAALGPILQKAIMTP